MLVLSKIIKDDMYIRCIGNYDGKHLWDIVYDRLNDIIFIDGKDAEKEKIMGRSKVKIGIDYIENAEEVPEEYTVTWY